MEAASQASALEVRLSYQAAIADLAVKALKCNDLDTILDEATAVVARTMGVEYCGVLQLQPGGETLLLRSGVGWREGCIGGATVDGGPNARNCYALQSAEVIIVDDWRTESRFNQPPFLREHGVISSICVGIDGADRRHGALGAHTVHHRAFTEDDARFLQAVADIIASAVETKETLAQFKVLYDAIADPILIYATDGRILNASKSACERLGYGREQLVTMTAQDIIAPKYARSFAERVAIVLSQGASIFESAYVCRDGTAFPVETRVSSTEFNGQTALLVVVRDTTERKVAELAREELARIVDTATDAVISKDLTGKITSWNRGAERLYGWRADEMIGRSVSVLVPTERQHEIDELTHIVETGELVDHFDAQRLCKDGQPIDVSLSLSPVRDGTGKIVGVSIIARDITRQKQAERALAASEAKFRSLYNDAPAMMYSADLDRRILSVSNAWLELFGYHRDDVIGADYLEFMTPENRQRVVETQSGSFTTGDANDIYYQFVKKNGEIVDVLATIRGEKDQRGMFARIHTGLVDVTEHKRAEHALRLSEERYRSFVVASADVVWFVDSEGEVTEDLPSWRAFTGQRRDEIMGSGWVDALHPDDRERTLAEWSRAVHEGSLYEVGYRVRRYDGEYRDVIARGVPVRNPSGAIHSWVGTCSDITERKKAEEAVRLRVDQYATILTASRDAFWLVDLTGKILDVNSTACELTGYSRDELLGRHISDLEAAESPEQTVLHVKKITETGYDHFESRHRKKDGGVIDVEISTAYWRSKGQIIIFIRDISTRKSAEEMVRDTADKLKEAQKIAQIGSWDWRMDSGALLWSDEVWRIFGRNPERPPPTIEEFIEYAHPDDRKRVRNCVSAALEGGTQFQLEFRMIRSDGEERVLNVRGKGYRDADGKPIRTVGVFRDITEEKRIEDRLKTASLYARSLIEASLDMLLTITPDGKIADINETTARMLGSPREQVIGADFASYFTDPERARAGYRTAFAAGNVTNYPLTMNDAEGNTIYLLFNASVYRSPGGEVQGVFATARDITEHKRREEELARMHEQMTATVAELRQHERDVAVIDGLSETLQICKDRAEAYPLIALAARQLFPGSSGALAVFVSRAHDLTTVARWGDAALMLQDFVLDDCWALRRGLLHQLDNPAEGALCHHFENPPGGAYLCLPLATPGEALGLLHVSAASGQAIDERMRRLVGTLGDVIKLSLSNLKMRETLRFQSIRDPLTGLFNRQYLSEGLPREIIRARRSKRPLCVAILDIDHFKMFNDVHGHDAGDLVLREVGDLLGKSVRGSDMACRYGGEEFLFVLPECDLFEAKARLEQIREEIKRRECLYRGRLLPAVTVSVGLAQFSDEMANEANLITAADQALYAAKDGGRDCIVVYSHDLRRMARETAA